MYYHFVCVYIYKECGSLRSPTPCLCIDFICVSTAWKVAACMVHQSQSVAWTINNGSKCRCTRNFKLHCAVHNLHLVMWRHWRPSTYFRHYLNQPAQKLVNCRAFSYLQRRQRRGHGENLLPPLRFYVQERHPGRATSPASNVTGRPSWRSHPPPALRAESVV